DPGAQALRGARPERFVEAGKAAHRQRSRTTAQTGRCEAQPPGEPEEREAGVHQPTGRGRNLGWTSALASGLEGEAPFGLASDLAIRRSAAAIANASVK